MAQNPDNVNDRLEQASQGGTPKLNPDEQRRYLGTFGERVSLVIPIKDMGSQFALKATELDMKKHPDYLLTINGNLDNDVTSKYMALASKNDVEFTMVNDNFYFTKPDSYGVVFANKTQAINQFPKLWSKKYPQVLDNNKSKIKKPQKKGFMNKLKHLF